MMFLIRGLPGSGKSTVAKRLHLDTLFEADQYFMVDGKYLFDPSRLSLAHKWCREQTEACLAKDQDVVVANTFTCRWELQPYLELAARHNTRVTVLDLFDAGCDDATLAARTEHGVPESSIAAMRFRYEHDWRNGNVLPPWERVA